MRQVTGNAVRLARTGSLAVVMAFREAILRFVSNQI